MWDGPFLTYISSVQSLKPIDKDMLKVQGFKDVDKFAPSDFYNTINVGSEPN